MNANDALSHETYSEYDLAEQALISQFNEAIILEQTEERYSYFVLGARDGAAHHMAIFCVANSVEPLRSEPKEELRLAIPIADLNAVIPTALLASENGHYFYLTYQKKYGSTRTVRVDDLSYDKLFKKRRNPPVKEFLRKIGEYTVVPLRVRDQGEWDNLDQLSE